jgi:hypothetical protein
MKRHNLREKWAHLRVCCLLAVACLLIASVPVSAAIVGSKKSDQQLYADARNARESNDYLTAALNLYAYQQRQPEVYLNNQKHQQDVDETLKRLIYAVKFEVGIARDARNEGCEAAQVRAITTDMTPMHLPPYPSICQGRPSPDQVMFFMHFDFQPPCVVKTVGRYDTAEQIGLPNDSISSLRVGSNVRAVLCMHGGQTGTCEAFYADDANLSNNTIGNDQVTSARVEWR